MPCIEPIFLKKISHWNRLWLLWHLDQDIFPFGQVIIIIIIIFKYD